MDQLDLTVRASFKFRFSALLEKGVGLTVNTGCTLRDLLCSQLGLSEDYLDQRIQTLFLNGRPVDDVDRTIVKDGSTLALSSAMPGLLGATMRKGGRYAPFRKAISQKIEESGTTRLSGHVTIKMFNMVAREVGNHLLKTGVEVDGADLDRVVKQFPGILSNSIKGTCLNGQPVDTDKSLFESLSSKRVRLSVTVVNHES